MARMRRLWVPVLVGCLVAVLLGPAGVTATEPRTVTASIMIQASAFTPDNESGGYTNNGIYLSTSAGSYLGFVAPIVLPVSTASIRRITLYAYDNSAAGVCVTLRRARPAAASGDSAAKVCSSNSPSDPQTVGSATISPRQVDTSFHGPMLYAEFSGEAIRLYGVKVTYTYEAGT